MKGRAESECSLEWEGKVGGKGRIVGGRDGSGGGEEHEEGAVAYEREEERSNECDLFR